MLVDEALELLDDMLVCCLERNLACADKTTAKHEIMRSCQGYLAIIGHSKEDELGVKIVFALIERVLTG